MAKNSRPVTFGATGSSAPPLSNVVRLTQRSEEQGFAAMWWADHLMGYFPASIWTPEFTALAQVEANPHLFLDPFVAMAAAGLQTSRIKVGTLVSEPVRRHPAVLAQSFLSVDHASKGRCIAGLGSGEAMNTIPYGFELNRPVARLEEAIKIIRLLWETDQPVSFEGEFWTLKDAVLGLGPYESGKYPPIWIAAHGPRMLQLVGKHGDGWLPYRHMDAREYGAMLGSIRQTASQHGRDPDAIVAGLVAPMVIDVDHDSCHRLLDAPFVKMLCLLMLPTEAFRRWGGVEHPLGENYPGISQFISTRHGREEILSALAKVPRDVCEGYILHGTPEEVASVTREYVEHGLEHPILWNMTFVADPAKLRSSFALTLDAMRYVTSG